MVKRAIFAEGKCHLLHPLPIYEDIAVTNLRRRLSVVGALGAAAVVLGGCGANSSGSNVSTFETRVEANPSAPLSSRQLNIDSVLAAGVQVIEAFEEVRPATRQPRQSQFGFLWDDQVPYAAYVSFATLFTTTADVGVYNGSYSDTPSTVYPATVAFAVSGSQNFICSPETDPNEDTFYYGTQDGGLTLFGTYSLDTGSYWFNFYGGAVPAGITVTASWVAFTTEVIRDEPSRAEKSVGSGEGNAFPVYSGDTNIQARPEDLDDSTLVLEVSDDVGWRRDIVAGGELNDLTIYQAGTELGIDVLTPQTVFRDQTGVDLNVFGVVSQYPPMRVITQVRLTDATYQPGNLAVGYQGVFRDTSQISSNDTSIIKLPVGATVGDTDTDYDTLFEPGYGLFHVGIAQGVMVADLPGFFGTHHRDNLAAWFALNEHPDDDLAPVDHSVYAGSLVPTGIDYSNRSYDSERGWSLGMAQASLNSVAARGIGQEVTASFWIRVTAPPVAQETIVQAGPTEFACDGTHIYAYLQDSNNNPQLVGSALLTAASLTLGGTTNFSNGDTVMVGGVTYTFQSILVNVPNNVLIASSLSFSLLNLKAAIAATLGAGITYGDGTAVNPLVTASHLGATLTMTVRASAAAIGTAFTLVSAVGGFTLQPSGEPSFSVASGTAYPFPVGWQFVYIRAASGTAFANFSTLSVFGTEVSLADPLIPASALNAVSVNAAVAEYNIHDLRVWNTCKTEADMDLVRYHDPTPTICTYPLGYIYTVDRQDRYGILVLPSGWAVAGGLPSWHRQSWQGLVRRYDSMGSYFGEDRFKETGIGEGRPLPATYLLGSQFTTLTSAGTATFSTTSGYLPGDNPLWEDLSNASGSYAPGTYASIAYDAGAVAAGTGFPVAYVNSGTESPWPSAMVQTNVFREAIWASDGPGQTMYEVTLDGSGTYAYLVFQPVARGRTAGEIAVSPVFGPLVQNGTFSAVIDAMPVSGVITGGTGTLYYPSGSQAFNVSDLYVSDQPTGPYTVNMAQLTATEPYNGISALTSFYMYLNSSINVEVPNAFDTWTDQGNTAQDNGVDYSANPQIVYSTGSGVYLNTPVLGVDGVLEFQNSSPLPAGNYVLTVVSGQVGQPDADLTGFDVTLTLNSTVLDLVLLNGQFNGGNGFNLTGTNVFPIQVTDAVSGNWLLSLDWTNALADQDTGTQRQLAIYSYSLRQLFTKPYQVQVGPLASPCAPIITLLDIGTVPGTVPGGWFAVLNSYGTASGYAHESAIYPSSDTVANTSPLSNILTSLTNERREDVIYTGTDVFISDAGSYAFPTFYGGTVAVAPGGLLQAGETGTFSVSGYGSLSDIYSYAWRFWDSTGTATPGPTVMKVINTGSNPMGAPAGLQLSCMPVGVDGQSTVLYGTLAANNGPIILAGGASISVNDAYFPYATQMGLTVFSFENLPLSFAWYAGATFLGSGVSSSAGLVAGTWSGNGTVEIGQFNGVQNYFDAVIGSPTEVTGVVTDASGGTASFDFSLRGQLPPPAAASAGASAIGLVASVSDVQRIGAGQSVDFTVYANSVTGGTLSFSWEFYGSHNWTVTGQSSGTTSILPNGGYQNTVSKDISGEVVAAGTQKTVEAVCDIFLTNLATQTTQMSQVTVDMVLLTNLPPSPMTISVSDNGVPIVNGIGTLGDVIEFDATGTDPNHDWVWYAWNFNQPFTPNVGLYWGPKVRLDTSRYTEGQAVSGVVTATDLLGSQFTFILPDILLFSS